jgi:LysR family glycine cleavage system transcriptional activator
MRRLDFAMPPLEWIRAFEAAARLGSFTAAGDETGVTQAAVSQRIAQLEKRLGVALFRREARSIALTLDGEAWLPHVQSALGMLQDSSRTLFGAGRSTLTVSASQSVIALWLQPRLGRLMQATTGRIAIRTMVLGAHEAPVDDVIRIRYGSGDWPHDHRLRLFEEEIAPVASPALIARGGNWTEWPRIACSGPRPGWHDWARRFGIASTPVPVLQFDTFLPALGATLAGHGALLASLPLCAADIAAGRLTVLGEDRLAHHQSYWALAGAAAMARPDWISLADALSGNPTEQAGFRLE